MVLENFLKLEEILAKLPSSINTIYSKEHYITLSNSQIYCFLDSGKNKFEINFNYFGLMPEAQLEIFGIYNIRKKTSEALGYMILDSREEILAVGMKDSKLKSCLVMQKDLDLLSNLLNSVLEKYSFNLIGEEFERRRN